MRSSKPGHHRTLFFASATTMAYSKEVKNPPSSDIYEHQHLYIKKLSALKFTLHAIFSKWSINKLEESSMTIFNHK